MVNGILTFVSHPSGPHFIGHEVLQGTRPSVLKFECYTVRK
eukprot:UN18271